MGPLTPLMVVVALSLASMAGFAWTLQRVLESSAGGSALDVGGVYRAGCHYRLLDATLPVPQLGLREELASYIAASNMSRGAELGVQTGAFSELLLSNWTQVQRWYLVDLWGYQKNYHDWANVADDAHEVLFQRAMQRLHRWQPVLTVLRMYTSEAAAAIPDGSLDVVYVDARHDYCGVKEDLELYYPKLKPNGILAGHDYMNASEVLQHTQQTQDWSLCQSGEVNAGAVRGAVDAFVAQHALQLTVTSHDVVWRTWVTRKPDKRLVTTCAVT